MSDTLKIIQGDALTVLRTLPSESVHCCVTSPPYWGLRDYGVAGQMGLEPTMAEFLAGMVAVFEEVRRVLRNDGTCWVNMGDSYSDKQLNGAPWRLAFAMQDAGWYLRRDIIWYKDNPMPESCVDRCTTSHEYIFHLTKNKSYFYDAFSIRDELAAKTLTTFGCKHRGNGAGDLVKADNWGKSVKVRKPKNWKVPAGWDTSKGSHGTIHKKGRGHERLHQGFSDDWDNRSKADQQVHGANKRSVWKVAVSPYVDAHFATYPPDLIKPCILAGCPAGGIVLDPFGGSGTTGQVAIELGRKAILIELNPKYIPLIEKRCDVTPGFQF